LFRLAHFQEYRFSHIFVLRSEVPIKMYNINGIQNGEYESLVVFKLATVNIENIDATVLANWILHNTHVTFLREADGKRT
jgi:hypothetical protein